MERLFKKEVIPWQWIFLAVIVGIGFILRIYNLNFPSVGYHNMKENEYLEIAENMLQDNDFLKERFISTTPFQIILNSANIPKSL